MVWRSLKGCALRVLVWFIFLLVSISHAAEAKDKQFFRADLEQFGYISGAGATEYSSLGFLSEDFLLVVVNQRVFGRVEAMRNIDEPPSKLIVFDLNKKQLSQSAVMAVMKAPGAVAPLTDGQFIVLSKSLVRVCSADLRCDKSFPTNGGLATLDADSLKLLYGEKKFTLRDTNASKNGTRSVSTELSSTIWNKITHPISIDEQPADDFRRISVRDNRSGKTLFSMHYNPKNHSVGPTLSPNGTRLAIVREGVLEVYELP